MHAIDPQSLLLEGARRVDEWALIAKKIPTFDVVYAMDRHQMMSSERELLARGGDPRSTDRRSARRERAHRRVEARRVRHGEDAVRSADDGSRAFAIGVSSRLRQPARADDKATEHRNLGVAFYKTGMYEEAQREFRRVDALRPNDAEAAFFLGLVALRQEQWAAAVNSFERYAATQSSPRPAVFVNLALAHERMGDVERARAAITEALSRGGRGDPVVQTNAAALAVAAHDYEAPTRRSPPRAHSGARVGRRRSGFITLASARR